MLKSLAAALAAAGASSGEPPFVRVSRMRSFCRRVSFFEASLRSSRSCWPAWISPSTAPKALVLDHLARRYERLLVEDGVGQQGALAANLHSVVRRFVDQHSAAGQREGLGAGHVSWASTAATASSSPTTRTATTA